MTSSNHRVARSEGLEPARAHSRLDRLTLSALSEDPLTIVAALAQLGKEVPPTIPSVSAKAQRTLLAQGIRCVACYVGLDGNGKIRTGDVPKTVETGRTVKEED